MAVTLKHRGGKKARKTRRSDHGKINQRARVMHGTLARTSGGLTKNDLKYNKWGRIVSIRKSKLAKAQNHLGKAGWFAKKNHFGAFHESGKTAGKTTGRRQRRTRRKSRKSRK
jgi:hypothetical protein